MQQRVDLLTLAKALELSKRRVEQLRDVGIVFEGPDGQYDVRANKHQYRMFKAGDLSASLAELGEITEDLEEGMAQIYAEESIEKRRVVAREVGPLIGRLDAAFAIVNALGPAHSRQLMRDYARMLVERCLRDLFGACMWNVVDEPAGD